MKAKSDAMLRKACGSGKRKQHRFGSKADAVKSKVGFKANLKKHLGETNVEPEVRQMARCTQDGAQESLTQL